MTTEAQREVLGNVFIIGNLTRVFQVVLRAETYLQWRPFLSLKLEICMHSSVKCSCHFPIYLIALSLINSVDIVQWVFGIGIPNYDGISNVNM